MALVSISPGPLFNVEGVSAAFSVVSDLDAAHVLPVLLGLDSQHAGAFRVSCIALFVPDPSSRSAM